MTDLTPTNSRGKFNRAAIRRHLLKVSKVTRKGRFTRVSEESLDSLEAIIEARIRNLKDATVQSLVGQVDPDEGEAFLTGEGSAALTAAFNVWIAREIHRWVNNVRVGKTL